MTSQSQHHSWPTYIPNEEQPLNLIVVVGNTRHEVTYQDLQWSLIREADTVGVAHHHREVRPDIWFGILRRMTPKSKLHFKCGSVFTAGTPSKMQFFIPGTDIGK